MKTLEQLGISITPWHAKVRHLARDIGWVYDKNDRAIFGVLLPSHAHLIAAAPDLYEALRVCVEELNKARKKLSDEEYFAPTMATNMAYAALKKAGGEEA